MKIGKTKIVAILENLKTGKKRIFESKNIFTNDGDTYYAQRGAAETPTNTFANLFLGSTGSPNPQKTSNFGSITLIAGTEKAPTATYPQTDDSDPDNTGAGVDVITWKYEYTGADGNWSGITEGVIAEAGASGTDPVLCHFSFGGAFDKDSDTSLKVFVNHEVLGS